MGRTIGQLTSPGPWRALNIVRRSSPVKSEESVGAVFSPLLVLAPSPLRLLRNPRNQTLLPRVASLLRARVREYSSQPARLFPYFKGYLMLGYPETEGLL